jgi:hypothetical protein
LGLGAGLHGVKITKGLIAEWEAVLSKTAAESGGMNNLDCCSHFWR